MSKYTIKKLIITIFFVLLLVGVFFLTDIYKKNKVITEITNAKQILDNKYDEVIYKENSNCIYSYSFENNKYIYNVFDLNGNKLYKIESDNELNITDVSNNYYILNDNELYNDDNEQVLTSNNMKKINENLLLSDDSIIDYKGNTIIKNVKNKEDIKLVYHNNYVSVDDKYLLDKKGKVLLENYKVVDEVLNTFITNYIIVKKDNKYYTYFTSLNKIIGVGFDYYYKENDNVYIYVNFDKYKIYFSGFRKKISSVDNIDEIKKKYDIDPRDIINDNYAFVSNKKEKTYGLLNLNSLKYYELSSNKFDYIKIDNNKYLIQDVKDYIYNLVTREKEYNINYKTNSIILYKNGYKSVNEKDKYYLLNDKGKEVMTSDKQIVLYDQDIYYGIYEDNVSLVINNEVFDANVVTINNDNYLYYELDDKKVLNDLKTKERYESYDYLDYSENTIAYKDNNRIIIKHIDTNKEYVYEADDIVNVYKLYKNSIVVEKNDRFEIIDTYAKNIKTIKNSKIDNIIYSNDINKMIIITSENIDNVNKKGSYIAQ